MDEALNDMYRKGRYREMLFILDTCKAYSFTKELTAPNLHTIASSSETESAVSHLSDGIVGEHLNDVFSYHFWRILRD